MTDKPKDLVILGRNVRLLRRHHEWPQSRLAQMCNLDRTTIVKIERGDHRPSVHTLELLAQAFGKPVGFLFVDHEAGPSTTVLVRQLLGRVSPYGLEQLIAYARSLRKTSVPTS